MSLIVAVVVVVVVVRRVAMTAVYSCKSNDILQWLCMSTDLLLTISFQIWFSSSDYSMMESYYVCFFHNHEVNLTWLQLIILFFSLPEAYKHTHSKNSISSECMHHTIDQAINQLSFLLLLLRLFLLSFRSIPHVGYEAGKSKSR